MRVLCLVLILANLGVAAWAMWLSEPRLPTRPISPTGPGIVLYAEAEAQAAVAEVRVGAIPAETGTVEIAPEQTPMVSCIAVGPLPNRVEVEETVRALAAGGFDARQRVAPGEVWLGYWVYIDAIATQSEAAEIVRSLAENEIAEAYVIADGNNGNIVSLGVFSQPDRARQRFADAESLGYSPSMDDRSQPGEVFWLDVTRRSGQEFSVTELPSLDVNPQLQLAACSTSAG